MKQKLKIKELKDRVLELRTQGLSYEEIARELQMSAQELLEWTKFFQETALEEGCSC
jgi:orotate phosphoribosyltransferase-like protein